MIRLVENSILLFFLASNVAYTIFLNGRTRWNLANHDRIRDDGRDSLRKKRKTCLSRERIEQVIWNEKFAAKWCETTNYCIKRDGIKIGSRKRLQTFKRKQVCDSVKLSRTKTTGIWLWISIKMIIDARGERQPSWENTIRKHIKIRCIKWV